MKLEILTFYYQIYVNSSQNWSHRKKLHQTGTENDQNLIIHHVFKKFKFWLCNKRKLYFEINSVTSKALVGSSSTPLVQNTLEDDFQ